MDAVAEIKSKLSVEDVVAEYVHLKRAGRNFKGLSPFNDEKTPSFIVSPEKQIWHDFSSGKGGDMFSFIQEVEGLDFKGSLELLARKAGVDLDQFKSTQQSNSKEKERLYEVIELATRFYQTQLRASRKTLKYLLDKRAFRRETVLLFRLGYSPNTGDALYKFLQSKGYTEHEMTRAGLITKRYNGIGDMFRGRLMVPLTDSAGRVVGFTARTLEVDTKEPKYINTPATLLYDKGRQAYGLSLAKEAIRKNGYSVVVEGNLDVIASHQAGVRNVVGAAGTALTEYHLKELNRFAGDVRFAFDGDRAGISATERAISLAQKVGVNVSIIEMPAGKDPDDLVREDPELWLKAISDNQYAVDWLIDRYKTQLDINSGRGKREFTDIILRIIRGLSDSVEQDHYVTVLAGILGISNQAISSKLAGSDNRELVRLKKPKSITKVDTNIQEANKTEQHLLSILLAYPKMLKKTNLLDEAMFSQGSARELFVFLRDNPKYENSPKYIKLLQSIGDYVKIVTLQFDELYRSLEQNEVIYELARLQERLIAHYVKNQKQFLFAKLDDASEDDERQLLTLDKELNDLLKKSKSL